MSYAMAIWGRSKRREIEEKKQRDLARAEDEVRSLAERAESAIARLMERRAHNHWQESIDQLIRERRTG